MSALNVGIYSDVNGLPAAELTDVDIAPAAVDEQGAISLVQAHFPQAQPVTVGEPIFVVLSLARPSGEMYYQWYNYYSGVAQVTAQSAGVGTVWRPAITSVSGVGYSILGLSVLISR